MFAAIGLAALMWMFPQPQIEPAATEADPAIFVIRDHDTTLYLFGTFHVLNPDLQWFDGPVEEAFAQSDELVVETLPTAPTVARTSLPPAASRMTPAATFLATTQDAVRAGEAQGMVMEAGADMVLLRAAAANGKFIEPLETLESQFAMISRIPSQAPAGAPCLEVKCNDGSAELSAALADLQDAWASGDHLLFTAMLDEMQVSAPDAYRILFVERNARWANWVAGRMRQPGTAFVAIGAAHLAGDDSLLVRLAERGLISRRVH